MPIANVHFRVSILSVGIEKKRKKKKCKAQIDVLTAFV